MYTIYTKVCGHPFKLVDSAISATSVADRCIKSSTQPWNLHRQTLAVQWPYWRAQWLSVWHHHRMPPFQQVSLSNFCPARAALVSAVIVKWKHLGVTTAQQRSGGPSKPTDRDRWVLKRLVCKNRLSSVATLPTEFQTAFVRNVSTITVCRELQKMYFHCLAAAPSLRCAIPSVVV